MDETDYCARCKVKDGPVICCDLCNSWIHKECAALLETDDEIKIKLTAKKCDLPFWRCFECLDVLKLAKQLPTALKTIQKLSDTIEKLQKNINTIQSSIRSKGVPQTPNAMPGGGSCAAPIVTNTPPLKAGQ